MVPEQAREGVLGLSRYLVSWSLLVGGHMRFNFLMFGFAFALTNCVGVADNDAATTPTPRVERPEWFGCGSIAAREIDVLSGG